MYKRLIILYHFFFFMAINNLKRLADKAERRSEARKKKGKPKMRVSGAGVKQLQRIILNKGK
jgi:hypothetical protein